MTTSGWRPGDLGRSKLACDWRPQFEAISASKAGVIVWHHMCRAPELIPVDTFRHDYTPDWKLSRAVPSHAVRCGVVYTMDNDLPCIQENVPVRRGDINLTGLANIIVVRGQYDQTQAEWDRKTGLYIRGKKLKVRRIKHDFASCDVLEEPTRLVVIPVEWISRWGNAFEDLWDHLEGDWSL